MAWALAVKLFPGECYKIPLMSALVLAWCLMAPSHHLIQCWPTLCYHMVSLGHKDLTHWGLVMHICISKLTTIGSDNGLSPGRRQAIIWTNAEILLIGTLGTNFSEILSKIHTFFIQENASENVCEMAANCFSLIVLKNVNRYLAVSEWEFHHLKPQIIQHYINTTGRMRTNIM